MEPLFAYFDPGAGSVLLQALVGGSAGLFMLAKYLLNSLRRRGAKVTAA